jgi:Fic family protein
MMIAWKHLLGYNFVMGKNGYEPQYIITGKMLNLVADISQQVGKISGTAIIDKVPQLRRDNQIKSIHSSLAIENNTLSIEQVTDVIDGKRILGTEKEIKEVKNTYDAYEILNNIDPYSVDNLLSVHKIMMNSLTEQFGKFRTTAVGVFNGKGKVIHIAPPSNMVNENIYNLFEWLKSNDEHPLIKSCVFHYEFEYIHPFQDGNGRMGRYWQTAILKEWQTIFQYIPVETIIKKHQQKYYDSINISNIENNCNPFIIFMLECILEAVNSIS